VGLFELTYIPERRLPPINKPIHKQYITINCPKCKVEITQQIETPYDKRIICGNCGTPINIPIETLQIDGNTFYAAKRPSLPNINTAGLYWIN
jgi:hypothetical protein